MQAQSQKSQSRIAKRSLTKRISGLKNWQPFVDNDGKASGFQSSVRKLRRTNTNPTLPALERMLLTAGRERGQCKTVRFTFRPSRLLRGLCSMRRSTADVAMHKMLSLELGDYIAKRSVFGKIPG